MIIATNQYTRMMAELFDEEEIVGVPTAFHGAFFSRPPIYVEDASDVEIDIVRSTGNDLAGMVHRGTSTEDATRNEILKAEKSTNIAKRFGLIEEVEAIDSPELLSRTPGMTPYQIETQQDRLVKKALKLHLKGMKNIARTIEYLAREAMLTGTHPVILGTTNSAFIYDFYRNSNNFITPINKWDSGSQDIYGDIDSGVDQIQQNSFMFSKDGYGLLLGTSAFAAFKADSEIEGDADNRRYGFVELTRDVTVPSQFAKYQENGFQPRGWIDTPKGRKIWIFTYDVTFKDDFTTPGSPVETEWMPLDQGLLFHHSVRCDRYFGPMDRLPFTPTEAQWFREMFGFDMTAAPMPPNVQTAGVLNPRMFHTYAIQPNEKNVKIKTQSAPIMATTQTDAIVTFDALVTLP